MKSEIIKEQYKKLYELDKKISRLVTEKRNYYLENIDEKDKNGNISIPLVASGNSDYEKLKDEKKGIELEIRHLRKRLANVRCVYLSITSELRKIGLSENKAKEEAEKRIEIIKKDIQEKISELESRIDMIMEEPKLYLRLKECERCNYSRVKSRETIKKLKEKDKEIKKLHQERKQILNSLKLDSEEETLLILALDKNKPKRS